MIGRSPHARRRRRWFAATACVLWLLGVEVLPNLHLAFHGDDHTHAADGSILRDDHDHDAAHAGHHHGHAPAVLAAHPAEDLLAAHEDHDHADAAQPLELVWREQSLAAHDHGDAAPEQRSRRERIEQAGDTAAVDHAPPVHDAAGIAHHAIALHRPPPPLLEPIAVPRAAWRLEHEPEQAIHDALRARPNARGPPATA